MSASTTKNRTGAIFAIVLSCLLLMQGSASADPVLDIVIGGESRHFGRDELLRRPDVAQVSVANDIAYGKAMTYRAVPVAALLAGLDPPDNAVIESVALDGREHLRERRRVSAGEDVLSQPWARRAWRTHVSDGVQQNHAIVRHQLVHFCEELVIALHTDVLKHAHRYNAIEPLLELAVVPQLKSDAVADTCHLSALYGKSVLLF